MGRGVIAIHLLSVSPINRTFLADFRFLIHVHSIGRFVRVFFQNIESNVRVSQTWSFLVFSLNNLLRDK